MSHDVVFVIWGIMGEPQLRSKVQSKCGGEYEFICKKMHLLGIVLLRARRPRVPAERSQI